MPYTPVQTNGKSYTIQKLLGSIKMDKMAIRDDRIFHVTTHHLCHYFYVSAGNEESKTFCYCCDRKVRAACAQSFTLWQQATIEIIRRDHSIIACSFHIYGYYSSHTSHSWWITHSMQHQPRGCNNNPFFLQQTAPITCSFCEVSTWHELHILVKAPFCCDQKDWASSAKSFTLWQQATIEIMHCNHSVRMPVIMFNRSQVSIGRDFTPQSLYYCLFTPHINGCYFSHTSHSWWSHIEHKANGEVATLSLIEKNKFSRHLFSQSMMW